jgi:hypothetical protein
MSSNVRVDKEKLQQSLNRLWEIYQDINDTVNDVSLWRCPYKNKDDRCTARFGCRNQSYVDGRDQLALCTGSDKLDYRTAWELE